MRNQVRREPYWKPRPQSRLTQLVKSRESWHFGSVPRSVGLGKGLSNTPRHPDSKQCVRYGTYSGILGAAKHTVVTPTSPMPILGVAPHLALDNAGNACLELQGPTPTVPSLGKGEVAATRKRHQGAGKAGNCSREKQNTGDIGLGRRAAKPFISDWVILQVVDLNV